MHWNTFSFPNGTCFLCPTTFAQAVSTAWIVLLLPTLSFSWLFKPSTDLFWEAPSDKPSPSPSWLDVLHLLSILCISLFNFYYLTISLTEMGTTLAQRPYHLPPQDWAQYLIHRKHLINICGLSEWIHLGQIMVPVENAFLPKITWPNSDRARKSVSSTSTHGLSTRLSWQLMGQGEKRGTEMYCKGRYWSLIQKRGVEMEQSGDFRGKRNKIKKKKKSSTFDLLSSLTWMLAKKISGNLKTWDIKEETDSTY